jgi:hypothetical protein
MRKFKNIDEVKQWLEPMDYQGFWLAIAPYNLVVQDRDHCDQQIAEGIVTQETALAVLKGLARVELTNRHNLEWKPATPWLKVVESY